MLIDTHAHMDNIYFFRDRDSILKKCFLGGVKNIINIGINYESSVESVKLSIKYTEVYASVGIHPLEVCAMNKITIEDIYKIADNKKVIAIGEIGLDYFSLQCNKEMQKIWFRKQICLAQKLNLPIIVHARKSHQDILQALDEVGVPEMGGVIHSFYGDINLAKEYIKRNFFISIGGYITYEENEIIKKMVKELEISKLLVETDSPYNTPNPFRKKRNVPLNLRYISDEIAKIKKMDVINLNSVLVYNAKKLFRI